MSRRQHGNAARCRRAGGAARRALSSAGALSCALVASCAPEAGQRVDELPSHTNEAPTSGDAAEPLVDSPQAHAEIAQLQRTFRTATGSGAKGATRRGRAGLRAGSRAAIEAGEVISFARRADQVVVHQATTRLPAAERAAVVALPLRASGDVELVDPASGMTVRFALAAARDAPVLVSDGLALYLDATGAGGHLLHRVTWRGTEDFLVLPGPSASAQVDYRVDVSAVAGLRLVANVLELLDEHGTPRLRMAAPYLLTPTPAEMLAADRTHAVGPRPPAASARLAATVEVHGCAVSRDGRAPWGRPVLPAGARECTVRIQWDPRALSYPALLDPSWELTSDMVEDRNSHAAALLADGRVLAVGGWGGVDERTAELYDPATNSWAATESMAANRVWFTAHRLADDRVLVVGGHNTGEPSSELYDPSGAPGAMWALPVQPLAEERWAHTAVLLADGRVLAAGGDNGGVDLASAELFDPATDRWTATGQPMSLARSYHAAALLQDGRMLVSGGWGSPDDYTACEIYDPAGDSWTPTGEMAIGRAEHVAGLLPDGRVLVTGGWLSVSAELFDPSTGTWAPTSVPPNQPRVEFELATLADGSLLLAAGDDWMGEPTKTAEIYDVASGTFVNTTPLNHFRHYHTTTRLLNGDVLVASEPRFTTSRSAELYRPGEIGEACNLDGECRSGHCADGLCCDAACDGECEACTAAIQGQGDDGTCGPIVADTDPDSECDDQGPSSCGTSGACDGTGQCATYAPGTVCGVPTCAAGEETSFLCDSTGTCVQATAHCAPYACAGSGCGTACNGDGNCDETAWCNLLDGTCQNDLETGERCERATQCQSGSCINGFCATADACLDERIFVEPGGTFVDCWPYGCGPTGCHSSCTSVLECAPPNVCDADGTCVAPTVTSDEGGCAVRRPERRSAGAGRWLVAWVVGLGWRRRRTTRGVS